MSEDEEIEVEEDADPSVPGELLELHLELEDAGITPEQFKEVYGNEDDN